MQGCPGEYEEHRIVHTVRRRGQVVVIDHVPADARLLGALVLTKDRKIIEYAHVPTVW